ncbi:MAG: helix-turn-helix transcriptional regulator [Catenulispora sp.]|nr:helix-turn-helix transcriptional regulator [Catenulispora sp.]NUT40033.1 helix-turn-helix transcriptional regulator [Thermoactinospora sp.]
MTDDSSTLASRLQHLIDSRRKPDGSRYTYREIGAATGSTHGHIHAIATGKADDPHVKVLVRIAEFFNVDPAYLIPPSVAGFACSQPAEVAAIAFRASRLDPEDLKGVQEIINRIVSGEIKPDNL